MSHEMIVCVPGPWQDRTEFVRRVITLEPMGRFMFAGAVLADVTAKDHVPLDFCPMDPSIPKAFEIAGQGKLPPDLLTHLQEHKSVAFLHFPLDLPAQRERLVQFSELLQKLGGFAVKVESSGIAHTWERWFALLDGSSFDRYSATVVLIGDSDYYYSCGMHHFGLPECAVPRSIPVGEAADLMNRFNYWQIAEAPSLQTGHTFSLSENDPRFRLTLESDSKHSDDHPFFNQYGIWHLTAA